MRAVSLDLRGCGCDGQLTWSTKRSRRPSRTWQKALRSDAEGQPSPGRRVVDHRSLTSRLWGGASLSTRLRQALAEFLTVFWQRRRGEPSWRWRASPSGAERSYYRLLHNGRAAGKSVDTNFVATKLALRLKVWALEWWSSSTGRLCSARHSESPGP